MRGWFAVLFDDEGIIQSGYGSHPDLDGAWREAIEWATAENLPLARRDCRPTSQRFYAGIGSRETPPQFLKQMESIARRLSQAGWTLRSGGADGADSAFERGAGDRKEIYLPWSGFNNRRSDEPGCALPSDPDAAAAIAANYHPVWNRLSPAARKLMSRNACQVLGRRLDSPSRFVLCWAPNPKTDPHGLVADVSGGTGLAVRLAHSRGIPVFHLDVHRARIDRFLSSSDAHM